MKSSTAGLDLQAASIESKRHVLTYLRRGPAHLTLESYLCLTQILSRAGWCYEEERWRKGLQCLTTFQAAIAELEQQVTSDRDRLLRQTVTLYPSQPSREIGRAHV